MPDLTLVSAGPVQVLPPSPPPWWRQVLTFLHLPGGIVATQPQPPTVSAQWVNMPAGGWPLGGEMQIAVTGVSLNTSPQPLTVTVVLGDSFVTPPAAGSAELTGSVAVPNALTASATDTGGNTWTVSGQKMTGQNYSGTLTATATNP